MINKTNRKAAAMPALFAFDVKREIVRETPLRAYAGWKVRTYRDEYGRETFDATNGRALSPLEASFSAAVFFAKYGEPIALSAPACTDCGGIADGTRAGHGAGCPRMAEDR